VSEIRVSFAQLSRAPDAILCSFDRPVGFVHSHLGFSQDLLRALRKAIRLLDSLDGGHEPYSAS
jgi:hypothetical protein